MSKKSIASLFVKLIGVFLLLQSVPALPYVLFYMRNQSFNNAAFSGPLLYVAMLSLPTLWVAICILVIRFSDMVAGLIVGNDEECAQLFGLSMLEAQTLAFCCIGLAVTVRALPEIPRLLLQVAAYRRAAAAGHNVAQIISLSVPRLVCFLLQLILGIGLFFGAPGVAGLWARLRRHSPTNE